MSKSSRRPVRPASTVGRPATEPDAPPPVDAGSASPTLSRSPSGTARAGRRERPRYGTARPSFLERYRPFVILAVVVAVVGLGAVVVLGVAAPTYACTSEWTPEQTPAPQPGESNPLGYIQPDQGTVHQSGEFKYTYCPPANGPHWGIQGLGPIDARLYGPEDRAASPPGWVHNLEHGGLALLYNCEDSNACNTEVQQQLQSIYNDFPPSPICGFPKGTNGPVIARFDEMAWPFAAILWNRVLPLETLDKELIYRFFNDHAERGAPELFCEPSPDPSASPSLPVASPSAPSASPSASAPASPSASPSASPAPSASPSPAAS